MASYDLAIFFFCFMFFMNTFLPCGYFDDEKMQRWRKCICDRTKKEPQREKERKKAKHGKYLWIELPKPAQRFYVCKNICNSHIMDGELNCKWWIYTYNINIHILYITCIHIERWAFIHSFSERRMWNIYIYVNNKSETMAWKKEQKTTRKTTMIIMKAILFSGGHVRAIVYTCACGRFSRNAQLHTVGTPGMLCIILSTMKTNERWPKSEEAKLVGALLSAVYGCCWVQQHWPHFANCSAIRLRSERVAQVRCGQQRQCHECVEQENKESHGYKVCLLGEEHIQCTNCVLSMSFFNQFKQGLRIHVQQSLFSYIYVMDMDIGRLIFACTMITFPDTAQILYALIFAIIMTRDFCWRGWRFTRSSSASSMLYA